MHGCGLPRDFTPVVTNDRGDAHGTTVDEWEKKRPDREGLSEAIGSPTAEVFEMKRPAIAARAGAGQLFVWWRADVLRAQ